MKDRIKSLRVSLGMSQQAFSEAIDVSRNFLSMVENGDRLLGHRTIKAIAERFNVNENWLENGEGEMLAAPAPDPEEQLLADVNPLLRAFVRTYRRLTPAEQEFMDRLIDDAVKEYQTTGTVRNINKDDLLRRVGIDPHPQPEEEQAE